jgi:hypothetical protein
VYKRKKTEMEQLRAEQQILERTLELLEERFEQIKENNVRGWKLTPKTSNKCSNSDICRRVKAEG